MNNKTKDSNFLRAAAVLYADDNQYVSIKNIHKKIIEAVFLENENKPLTIIEIIEQSLENYNLIFEEGEIIDVINNEKNSEDFEIQNKSQIDKTLIKLSLKRYSLIIDKERSNNIDPYITKFISINYPKGANFDIKETIYKYLYDLLHTNISSFSKLTNGDVTENINIDSDVFSIDEREVINAFLNWDHYEKNKALFSIVSYSIEYCLLTNKRDGTDYYLKGIKDKLFYLDTNIIFRALGINGKNRQTQILIFLQKCIENGERLFISKYSELEFKEAIDYHIKQIQKVPTGRVNPKIFEELSRSSGVYDFFHKWRIGKSNSGYELFKAYIFDLFDKFINEFKIQLDYKIPYDENDEKIIKKINEYSKDIGSHKTSENASGNFETTNYSDAQNIYLIEKKRGDNSRNISDTKYFFISTDQSLRRWDFLRSITVPIILLPSQWMSILLKYISRTSNDYKSFVSFLNLKQSQPILRPETLHVVLAGISEITEDFAYQSSIIHRMVEIKFDGIISNNLPNEDIIENSKNFSKRILEEEINNLKESKEAHKLEADKLKESYVHEVEDLRNNIKLHESDKLILLEKNRARKFNKWQNQGRLALLGAIGILVFGIYSFLPTWDYNFPAHFMNFIDSLASESRKDLLKIFNGVIYTGIFVGLVIIFYQRLIDKKNILEYKKNINPMD